MNWSAPVISRGPQSGKCKDTDNECVSNKSLHGIRRALKFVIYDVDLRKQLHGTQRTVDEGVQDSAKIDTDMLTTV
jgi:hypothetical protein